MCIYDVGELYTTTRGAGKVLASALGIQDIGKRSVSHIMPFE